MHSTPQEHVAADWIWRIDSLLSTRTFHRLVVLTCLARFPGSLVVGGRGGRRLLAKAGPPGTLPPRKRPLGVVVQAEPEDGGCVVGPLGGEAGVFGVLTVLHSIKM